MKVPIILSLVLTLLLPVGADSADNILLVNTTTGLLLGSVRQLHETKILTWLGVPYAEPPTGRLRFKRTVPKQRWAGIRNATEQPKICFQTNRSTYTALPHAYKAWRVTGNMSEDCLYLNVLKPSSGRNMFYPTIVWVHGGTFYRGSISATMYDPGYLVAKGDVMVVSVQYRLGPFGFLGLGVEKVPGNMGLLDQAMALKWVQDNIEAFGGDKDNITLMGHSAGAALVGYHMISNMTRNMFRKVIMQSGGPFSYWSYLNPHELVFRSMLVSLGANCTSKNASLVYKCLMSVTPEALLAADKSPLALGPTTDRYFLHKSPISAVQQKDFSPKPVLGGLVRSEGIPGMIYVMNVFRHLNYSNFSRGDFMFLEKLIATYLAKNVTSIKGLGQYYLDQYAGLGQGQYIEAAIQFFGDFTISCPTMDFLQNVTRQNSPLYLYYFNHRSVLERDPPYTGVMHGADVPYVFGQPFLASQNYTDLDRNISDSVIQIWASFAKTGVPTGNWTAHGGNFLEIRASNETSEMKRREPFCSEWWKYANYRPSVSAAQFLQILKKVKPRVSKPGRPKT